MVVGFLAVVAPASRHRLAVGEAVSSLSPSFCEIFLIFSYIFSFVRNLIIKGDG